MRALVISGLLLVFVCNRAPGEELMATITFGELLHADSSGGTLVKAFKDGNDAGVEITHTSPDERSFMLAGVFSDDLEMTRVVYSAIMSSRELLKPASLELHAVISGQPVHIRSAGSELVGTQPPRPVEVQISLRRGEVLERVRLGVHFDGPGTVILQKLELWNLGPEGLFDGPLRGIAGVITAGILVLVCGLWGLVWYVVAAREEGPRIMLNTTLFLASASGVTLAAGTVAWNQNLPQVPWQPVVLLGTAGTAIFGVGYLLLQWRYGLLEPGDAAEGPRDTPSWDSRQELP